MSGLLRDVWFCLTLLSGKADESTVDNVDQEALFFSVFIVATLGSLLLLGLIMIYVTSVYGDGSL